MTEETNKRVLDLIEMTIGTYKEMLQKIVIERDKEFNAVPFERAISALNQLLSQTQDLKESLDD